MDLVVSLFDKKTQRPITEKNVHFKRGNKTIRLMDKGGGNYIAMNDVRENFMLQIQVFGYEGQEVWIDYNQLSERMPLIRVELSRRGTWEY